MLLFPVLIFLAVGVYGMVHSFLASIWFKERLRRWFGPSADRWYRLAYNIFATLSLLPVLALPVIFADVHLYTISIPWIYFSIAGQLVAVVMLVAGLLQTGVWSFVGLKQLLGEGPEPGKMVLSGLYRYVRHPLYTAGLLFIWLTPVMSANLLVLNLGLTAYLILGAIVEERKLRQEFGQAYVRYQAETPMFIPRWPGGK